MPSESCLTCSQRQILCDGTKPSCQRCLGARRKCRGYDRGLKLVFYDAGSKQCEKATRAQTRRNKALSRQSDKESAKSSSECQSRSSAATQKWANSAAENSKETSANGTSVNRSLTMANEADLRPVCLFISAFVPNAKHGTMLEFVPELYKNSSSISCFKQSLQAVSLLNFMNRYKAYHVMQSDVRDAYCAAIKSTNSALSNKKLVSQDETLASVWLLSLYELLAFGVHTFGEKTPWINHVQGTLALLRIRGRSRAMTKIGRQLFTLVYIPIIVMLMMGGQHPPADIAREYQEVWQADGGCPSALISMILYIHKVADWRARARRACEHLSIEDLVSDSSPVIALLSEGLQLSNLDGSEKQDHLSDSGKNFNFASINDMSYELTIWTTNLLAIQTLLQLSLLCQSISTPENGTESTMGGQRSLNSILKSICCFQRRPNDLADRILNSVHYAFGERVIGIHPQEYSNSFYDDVAVGAYHMFWPLGALVASPFVTEQRKTSARAALRVVGERFCIVQALRYI